MKSVFGTYPPLSGSSGMTAHLAAMSVHLIKRPWRAAQHTIGPAGTLVASTPYPWLRYLVFA